MLKQMREIGMCLLLSVVLTSNTWGREFITIYQTEDLKVENLQRINHNTMDVTLVELGKLEQLEAALTQRVNLPPGVSADDACAQEVPGKWVEKEITGEHRTIENYENFRIHDMGSVNPTPLGGENSMLADE